MRIKEYENYLKVDRELSENSRSAYLRDINEFMEFAKAKTEEEITRTRIREFLSFLEQKCNEPITRRRKLTSLRMFFKFLEDEKYIKESPVRGLSSPKVETKEPSYLTEKETKRLIHAVEEAGNKRDTIFIRIFIETGIRLNELANLDVGNIDVDNRTIKVQRKGNKQQTIPINSKLSSLLSGFIKNKEQNEPLIMSSFKRRMTNRRIGLLVKDYLRQSGITKNVSCHSIRHSFCTRLLEKGADIKTIQILAGHTTLEATQRYLHIAMPRLRKEVLLAEI